MAGDWESYLEDAQPNSGNKFEQHERTGRTPGVGYEFDWGDVELNYRCLEYDEGSDGLLQNIGFGGFMLGAAFQF